MSPSAAQPRYRESLTLSIGPAARSVAEASGRALWLLDFRLSKDGVGARDRVARLFLDIEEDLRSRKKIAYAFKQKGRHELGEAHRVAKEQIRRAGVFWQSEIITNDKNGAVKLRGGVLPGPGRFVRIAGEIFGDDPKETDGHYSYMSSMTHPSLFAFIETLSDAAEPYGNNVIIPLRVDGEFSLTITSNTVRSFYNAWRAWIAWTDTGDEEVEFVYEAHRLAIGDGNNK